MTSTNVAITNYVNDLASRRDALSVYPRRLVQNYMSLSDNQIWGRIFSFLPPYSKQAVALTCTSFNCYLKEEDERYVNAILNFISEYYVIIDSNVDLRILRTKIKHGIAFLLGDCHDKPSHLKVHEAFMQLVVTPQSRIFTETPPHHYTKDMCILNQSEQWSSELLSSSVFNNKLLDKAPPAVSPELLRFLKKTNCVSDLAISTTLIFLSLVKEKNGQKFAQALLFFYNLLNCSPKFAFAPLLGMLANGQKRTKNFDKGPQKKAFLDDFHEQLIAAEKALEANFLGSAHCENQKKNHATLITKITKVFEPVTSAVPKHPCVLAQGAVGHFISPFQAKAHEVCDPITLELSIKMISYIALYPQEFLISTMPPLTTGSPFYHSNIQVYIEVDAQLALKEGKNQENDTNKTFAPYLNEETAQEFLAFLKDETREKSAFRSWPLVGQAVRQHALATYQKQS